MSHAKELSPVQEPTTIGLSEKAHGLLKRLKEDGHFGEMVDAYRFAIAIALAHGVTPPAIPRSGTIFNVGTLDPDRSIYFAVRTLVETGDDGVYRWAERLAEWGVLELWKRVEGSSHGTIDFTALYAEIEKVSSLG